MPVHDWTRVDDATFHDFHQAWITHIKEALNHGVLPAGYYAMGEQVATRMQTDILALRAAPDTSSPPTSTGGLAVLEIAPSVRTRVRPSARQVRSPLPRRRRVVVRHISGRQVVAVIEVVSPANKDRASNVKDFADKVVQLLAAGIHVLVVDLLPPRDHDPQGMHGAIWSRFDQFGYQPPAQEPFTLASYRWDGNEPEAFLEPIALGRPLVDMPLFLTAQRYVNVPLEATYTDTYQGMSDLCRPPDPSDR